MAPQALDSLRDWDFPSNPYLPEWLLYSDNLSDEVEMARLGACLAVVLVILIFDLCVIVMYLTSKISYASLLKQLRRPLIPLLASYVLMAYWSLGAKITLEILVPLAVLILWLRYINKWFGLVTSKSTSLASSTLSNKTLDVESKDPEAVETPDPTKNWSKLKTLIFWLAIGIPFEMLLVYLAWFNDCLSATNPLVPSCIYLAYAFALANQNKYIGPEGKWRAALEPYIGFCLPDANRPFSGCADGTQGQDGEDQGPPPPKNKWKWFFHGLIHFSIFMYFQHIQRTFCEASMDSMDSTDSMGS